MTSPARLSLKAATALALVVLAGCGAPVADLGTTVRHVGSNDVYGDDGARFHLFIFDPARPRSLADRKAIAKRQIALEPGCRWVDAPDAMLIEATRAQGARYVDTVLVAPLRCSRT